MFEKTTALIKKTFKKFKFKDIIIAVFLAVTFFLNSNLFLFAFFTMFGAVFCYYHDKYNKTMFDFRLTYFLGIMLARHYPFFYILIFMFLAQIIPNILAGGRIDGPTFAFYVIYLFIFSTVPLFSSINIIIYGLVLVFVDGILGVFVNLSLGVPNVMAISAAVVAVTIRIIYFLTLGSVIEFIFTYV